MKRSCKTCTAIKRKPRRNWANVEVVYVPIYRPFCPRCGSEAFEHIRGEDNGDNSTTERVVCRDCSEPYKIVRELSDSELPDLGNG